MAKRKPINYYATRDCYRKHYKGKARYFCPRKPGETEGGHYDRALREWDRLKASLDGEAIESPSPHVAGFAYDYSTDGPLPAIVEKETEDVTVDELAEAYLTETRLRAECGELAISSYREVKDCLADFQGFCQRHKIAQVNQLPSRQFSEILRQYKLRQQQLQSKGEHSPYTTKKRLRHVKCLIEWAYHNEYLEALPRSIGNGYTKVKLPDPTPQHLTKAEVQKAWKQANSKHKFSRKDRRNALFILLGLNCGYRSGDISSLKHEDVDWETLIIERKRHKTGAVSIHKLWPETAELLKAEMTDPAKHELMLLDERGQPLIQESLDKATPRLDSIARRFIRLREKLGWGPGKGHSALRDTGAQFIKDNFGDLDLVKQYLSHKSRDVSRHYISETIESRSRLFEATEAMREHFDLEL